jgi:hypothetical protein
MAEMKLKNISAKEIDKMPSVFIAIPNMGKIQTDLMLRVIQWIFGSKSILFPPQNFSPISVARNKCVEEFLKQGYDYIFFVDSDTVPPPDALAKLLSHRKKLISGVTCNLKLCSDGILRPAPMVFKYANPKKKDEGFLPILKHDGVDEIVACGMSCCLIHKDVFKGMKDPWFEERPYEKYGKKPLGEDFDFCEKVIKKGIKMYADFSVKCSHHKVVKIDYPNQVDVVPAYDVSGDIAKINKKNKKQIE